MGQTAKLFDFLGEAPDMPAFAQAKRIAEALLFAAGGPLPQAAIAARLPPGTGADAVLHALRADYAARGIELVRAGDAWMLRTAPDLSWLETGVAPAPKKLSRAAMEILAIIAYHQPVTRAEIEEIRGVALYRGTLDVLVEAGWVRLRARRQTPGRPVTYGTTTGFLAHFGLEAIGDLPGLEEMRAAGLFEGKLPRGFGVPQPSEDDSG